MSRLLFIISTILLLGCSTPPNHLSEAEYTKKYLRVMSAKYPQVVYEIKEPLVLKATYGQDEEVSHFLDNSYREYKLDPKAIDEVMDRYVNVSIEVYNRNDKIDVHRIVPIIKSSNYFEQLNSYNKTVKDFKTPELLWEPYNEDLIVVYAEDRDRSIHYFNQEEFDKLNISKDTLLTFATTNLDNIIPKIERMGQKGSYALLAGGEYEASLILIADLWTKMTFDVQGNIVIAIPNRDLVFVTGSLDDQTITKLRPTIKESYDTGNYAISPHFYKWNGKKFERM